MTSVRSLLVLLVAGASLWPSPAAAGGGWWNFIDLDSEYLATGETFTFRQQIAFPDSVAAEEARSEDYGAYLMQDINQRVLDRAMGKANPKRWWEPVDGMMRVGDVTWLGSNSNLYRVSVRLSIPEIPPGTYYLMLCDPGCRTPLADIVPTTVRVTDEPLAAQASRQIERYRAHFDSKLLRIDALARRSIGRARGAEQDIAEMSARIGALNDRLERLRDRPQPFPWVPVVSAAALGAFFASVLMLVLKARRAPVVSDRPWETPTETLPAAPSEPAEQTKEPVGVP